MSRAALNESSDLTEDPVAHETTDSSRLTAMEEAQHEQEEEVLFRLPEHQSLKKVNLTL
ncbi:hypothetical protein EC973_008353 [Apophysomyces ossiformis]|uniref:Uncharacterized protein n=1 Tax=Apophysomyces ossiformis TaxID=679940 RepID=A0A8H7BL65_9FUNG|nr:hypothetical protein EC973_008353 [Apophysomyces ossiformis]